MFYFFIDYFSFQLIGTTRIRNVQYRFIIFLLLPKCRFTESIGCSRRKRMQNAISWRFLLYSTCFSYPRFNTFISFFTYGLSCCNNFDKPERSLTSNKRYSLLLSNKQTRMRQFSKNHYHLSIRTFVHLLSDSLDSNVFRDYSFRC